MASEQVWQRSEIMGTQVITREGGRRLGIVAEILVDVDRREVVALGLRDSVLTKMVPGVPRYMLLESICQVGDVILVDSDEAIQDINIEPFSTMINSEVITEAGDPLGRVRGFQFNIETGNLESLVIASVGVALIPEQVLSTYNLPIDEIVSSGPDRIIVFEGAEERLQQLTTGWMERLGIGVPPWEKDDDTYVLPTISAENQLGTGIPAQQQPQRQSQPNTAAYGQPAPVEQTWDEDYRQEPEPILRDEPRREQQRRYMAAEPEPSREWSDASNRDTYDDDYGYEEDRYATAPPTDVPLAQSAPPPSAPVQYEPAPQPEADTKAAQETWTEIDDTPKLELGQQPVDEQSNPQ